MKRMPSLVLGTTLATCALVALSAASFADENPVDSVVETTGGVIDSIVDGAKGAADTVTDSATWDRIAGNWKQLQGNAKAQWGKLTDDDMEQVDGNKDVLVGKVQEAYGTTRMEAEQQVDSWAADND